MGRIPAFMIDCVVAIGVDDGSGGRKWVASGFLYGDYANRTTEKGVHLYYVYLVTNRHIFQGKDRAYFRCNPRANEPAKEHTLELKNARKKQLWTAHPDENIDVAVIPAFINTLREQGMQVSFLEGDASARTIAELRTENTSEGDFVYILGFPMGLVGEHRNNIIVRSGSIARIRDMLAGNAREFLVDASIFPGNSGGPVISRPELPDQAAKLIGVVTGYLSYNDVAVSSQTGKNRVVFEENSGLASVHPVDMINETIIAHNAPKPKRKKT